MDHALLQIISLVGSMLVLAAFAGSQFKMINSTSLAYVLLNFIGSTILSIIAILEAQWGFLLLEGVWALISLLSLVRLMRGKQPEPLH